MKPQPAHAISLHEGAPSDLPAGARPVEGARAGDARGLLAAVAAALDFPDYFGGNWDALDECLADLRWLSGPATLVFRSAGQVLKDEPESRLVLLRILVDAGASSGLRTVFQDQGEALRPWRELCATQRIPFSHRP